MSDHDSIDPRDRDWLCALLDEPERGVEVAAVDSGEQIGGARCEYLAILALLGQSVAPATPPTGLEERVLAAARGAGAAPARRRQGPRRWALPLAATLAIAAAGFSAWQASRLGELRATVERQGRELAAARAAAGRLTALEGRSAEQRAAISLMTAAGSEFCPLRPPGASPTPGAMGLLVMSGDGEHFYLRVVGLEPRADGREYRLWFLDDGEPVDGAVLPTGRGDEALELLDGETPERFNAVTVTLEPAGSDRPSGPRLLFGDQRMGFL